MSPSGPPISPPSAQPLRSALKPDGDGERASSQTASNPTKAVQIAEPEPEPKEEEEIQLRKQFSAGIAKRLSGRPPLPASNSSKSSLTLDNLEALNNGSSSQSAPPQDSQDGAQPNPQHSNRTENIGQRLIAQVADWLEHERVKNQNRKSGGRRHHHSKKKPHNGEAEDQSDLQLSGGRNRSYSIDSQSSEVSLDRLQRIIDDSMGALGLNSVPHYSPKLGRRSQRRRSIPLQRGASSDTDFFDGDVLVPSCDGVLDNSETMGYSGGKTTAPGEDSTRPSDKEEKEYKAWHTFKSEIIRLTHTLRLKGWRRVSLDGADTIAVDRISGALTNAVYVVTPPSESMLAPTGPGGSKKTPAKLLLRIYGPQVEHIIDRENELSVLRRLARKRIGPRLLGTFKNGRFEQYLNANPLTAESMRDPSISKRIAKRMRELHDGIELLPEEIKSGPAVWKNWDNWVERVEQAVSFLDDKVISGNLGPVRGPADAWKERGLVLGVEWPKFRATVEKFRAFLNKEYGNPEIIRKQLVFAHSDTQYGNILRVRPDDEKSPLLQPNYEHKQLVVIDFEYSAANTRGYEFANHFNEWSYNYHDEAAPHACKPHLYPKPEEQRRFIKSYVDHRPEYPHASASTPNLTPLSTPSIGPSTPGLNPTNPASTSSIVEFMLDARVPPGGWREEERRQEEEAEQQISALMAETRLWRVANHAFWIAWGIMQTKIPGLNGVSEDSGEEELDFDYLGYSQERALFFWGDCILLGLLKPDDLPEALRARVKFVGY